MKKFLIKAFYLLFPIILGSIVGLIIFNFIDYETLVKPPYSPPKILFPIIWSIIYLLMGISYLIYKNKEINKENNIIYYFQLFVNLLWSFIFFIFKWRFISVLWIFLLDILVILTIRHFKKYSNVSSYLFVPYLIWSLFATYLTIGIYILN